MLASKRPSNAVWWMVGWTLSTLVTGVVRVPRDRVGRRVRAADPLHHCLHRAAAARRRAPGRRPAGLEPPAGAHRGAAHRAALDGADRRDAPDRGVRAGRVLDQQRARDRRGRRHVAGRPLHRHLARRVRAVLGRVGCGAGRDHPVRAAAAGPRGGEAAGHPGLDHAEPAGRHGRASRWCWRCGSASRASPGSRRSVDVARRADVSAVASRRARPRRGSRPTGGGATPRPRSAAPETTGRRTRRA